MKPLYQLSVYTFFTGLSMNVLAHEGGLHHALFHNSLVAGFMHPLTGMDHLVAMLIAGALLANAARSQFAVCTIVMLLALLSGTALGALFGAYAAIELLVMSSCFILSGVLLVKHRYEITAKSACALLCSFFVAHGWAHGAELPSENIMLFISGFLLAAIMLFALGMLLMRFMEKVLVDTVGRHT